MENNPWLRGEWIRDKMRLCRDAHRILAYDMGDGTFELRNKHRKVVPRRLTREQIAAEGWLPRHTPDEYMQWIMDPDYVYANGPRYRAVIERIENERRRREAAGDASPMGRAAYRSGDACGSRHYRSTDE